MKAPEGARSDTGFPLYGEDGDSINRPTSRRTLIAALGLAAVPWPAFANPKKVTTLQWRGKAHLEVEGQSLDIATDTSLHVPTIGVRSTTYIIEKGPQTARTLILEPDGVWLERDGKRRAMPEQFGVHERDQFATYAWLLKLQQGKRLKPGEHALSSPPWPDMVFTIGADGLPTAAEFASAPDDDPAKPRIAQRIDFGGGWLESNGVRWPRRFDLTRGGKPYFLLESAEFRAR